MKLWPVFHSVGLPPRFADPVEQLARGLDVEDDFGAGVARQHVVGEQHQLAVGEDDAAVLGDHAQAVAVAVEGEAQFRVRGLEPGDQVLQIVRHGGVGMVVGEGAVHLAEHFFDLAAHAAIEFWREGAGHAVAAIDDDLHRPRQLDVADDAAEVGLGNVVGLVAAVGAALVAVARSFCSRRTRNFWMVSPDRVSPPSTIFRPL